MGRAPCCDNKEGLKKGPWTPQEDEKLIAYIQQHGHDSWKSLPQKAGLLRCGKSCRLRWANYLRPGIKRGNFSLQEEQTIIQFHALLGNKWSAIAAHLQNRTDNEVKNHWNTHLKKRLLQKGIDPTTHKPTTELFDQKEGQLSSDVRHKAQWETARLQAEARLRTASASYRSHSYATTCLTFMNTVYLGHHWQPSTESASNSIVTKSEMAQNSLPDCSHVSAALKCSNTITTTAADVVGYDHGFDTDMVVGINSEYSLDVDNKDCWSEILDCITSQGDHPDNVEDIV